MYVQPSPTPPDDLDEAVAVFVRHRRRLFGIAYRMLGSPVEAEDVVQEVWLRWQMTDRSVVVNPVAFLSSATTRLAINVTQSARVRRETCIGPWLPEPVDTSADPEVGAQRAEAVELALLLVLERLNPVERAAYVLREAFDYAYAEIADMLELSLANVRKIVSRARRHLLDEQRGSVDVAEHRRLLNAFLSAARTGDVPSLEALLTPDAVSFSEGNGTRGRARVAELSARRQFWREAEPDLVDANGPTGVVVPQGRPDPRFHDRRLPRFASPSRDVPLRRAAPCVTATRDVPSAVTGSGPSRRLRRDGAGARTVVGRGQA
ncbi:sigma-70 family RNA polymerase sigma factor [Streptomyces sp. NBC_01396]|uniref:sigma-70 family RNA polymerase sigma factor n=1 Tax=Streptomyces sp. NBC_01396 TaxID=2903852 RepID=UPI0032467780